MADGLTVPFALAAGLAAAVSSTKIIVTAGLAEIVAGAVAMGLGGYMAARTDVEHYGSERKRENWEIDNLRDKEVAAIGRRSKANTSSRPRRWKTRPSRSARPSRSRTGGLIVDANQGPGRTHPAARIGGGARRGCTFRRSDHHHPAAAGIGRRLCRLGDADADDWSVAATLFGRCLRRGRRILGRDRCSAGAAPSRRGCERRRGACRL
jgi:hypothetical protein